MKIPPRCPRANCYGGRFVRTVRSELTDRTLVFSQHHLTAMLREYVEHYNTQRPHRGQHLGLPLPPPIPDAPKVAVAYRYPILGDSSNEYHAASPDIGSGPTNGTQQAKQGTQFWPPVGAFSWPRTFGLVRQPTTPKTPGSVAYS